MGYNHHYSLHRTFPGAKTAFDAGLLIGKIRVAVRVSSFSNFGERKTMNRACIDTDPAGHTSSGIEMRSFPHRFLYHHTDNTERISHGALGTNFPACTTFNTQITINNVTDIFISPYGVHGTYFSACTASSAGICNSIRHVHRHGCQSLPCSPQLVCPSWDPIRIVNSNHWSTFPCPSFFPGLLLPLGEVCR